MPANCEFIDLLIDTLLQSFTSQLSEMSEEAAKPQNAEGKEATPLGALWYALELKTKL